MTLRAGEGTVHVVPHSHWDREWYLPFSIYRRRLVELIDSLLVALSREPGLRFHLDGQMAMIDDYLEVRPEMLGELRRAAASGRVSLGPWYTLPDEHLVSGESLIRNLELGLRRAAELGVPMLIGYLPDQFGHTAQMPQILARQGIHRAVVWRGVPAGLGGSFSWEALDGTPVHTVHLERGYGHGRSLPLEAEALRERLEVEATSPRGPWLVMAGDDHLAVPVGLATALAGAAGADQLRPARISSLEDYFSALGEPTVTWRGELHSPATSSVLKGTLSSRFPLKLEHAAVERLVERHLEPVWALSGRPWPEPELAYIWRQLILNSAHDTICGCSVDQVHEQATNRLDGAARCALALLARLGDLETPAAHFNPSLFTRSGVPPLGTGVPERMEAGAVELPTGLLLESTPDRGDLYTHEPAGAPRRYAAAGMVAEQIQGEPFTRLLIEVANDAPNHRLRLLVPASTRGGAWAGVAFGMLHRPFRRPGTWSGHEADLATDPARYWLLAGGTAVILAGPFEYELLEDHVAVTLLRSVGRLSRDDLTNRLGHAGPGIATPGAQMIGRHHFELAIMFGETDPIEVARWADAYLHPLAPAPGDLPQPPPRAHPKTEMMSSLRRVGKRLQLRTYDLASSRISEEWLDLSH